MGHIIAQVVSAWTGDMAIATTRKWPKAIGLYSQRERYRIVSSAGLLLFFFFFLIGTTSHHRSYECRIFILPAFHTTRTSVYVLIITTGIRGESPIGGS